MIGAEANRLAEPLAASEAIPPRRHFHSGGTKSFELETANLSLSLGVPKGGFSFAKENGPLLIPQEKGFAIASEQLEELQCLPIALPIARRCRV